MTTYKLVFHDRAEKGFKKLGSTIRQQFKIKLAERLQNPHVIPDRLSGFENCYKIKLRSAGYRLIYRVEDDIVSVIILAVGKRDFGKNDAYAVAKKRI